jgi:hypothetical protein
MHKTVKVVTIMVALTSQWLGEEPQRVPRLVSG